VARHTGLFTPIYQTAVGILSPVAIAKEASNLEYKLWENRDLTVQAVIAYIYLCELWYASCLYFFSKRRSVMHQKPN
jgi:hypothetical protein